MKIAPHHMGVYCNDIDESIGFYTDILGFRHLFSTETMEGDKPLKMAWVKSDDGMIIELCLNHFAVRVTDMDEIVGVLNAHGIAIEAGPFDALCPFDRPLDDKDSDVFTVYGEGGAKLKIMFFRGPGSERIEAVQDNIGPLD